MPTSFAWREVARDLAPKFHETSDLIEPEVAGFLLKRQAAGPLIVMCSGGADSVAAALWVATCPHLAVARVGLFYCDHGLRSEAKGEAAFVRELAGGLGFDFHLGERSETESTANEHDLRRLRERALADVLKGLKAPIVSIVTGHHADDVAENLLFRLARGSGLSGMSGMRPVQTRAGWPVRLRPLLRWRRDALRATLIQAGVHWCEDASNAEGVYARNRIRKHSIPALEAAMPERSVVDGLLRCHGQLREIDAWIEERTSICLSDLDRSDRLPRAVLERQPLFVQRRVLEKFIHQTVAGINLSSRLVEAVLHNSDGPRWHLNATTGLALSEGSYRVYTVEPEAIDFGGASPVLALRSGDQIKFYDGGVITADEITLDLDLKSGIIGGHFSPAEAVWLANVELPLSVRSWEPGDRYQPLGAPGSRKLQDCFVDAGIERKDRKRLPIVCDARGCILWVPGLPPSDAHRLQPNTSQALRLTYKNR